MHDQRGGAGAVKAQRHSAKAGWARHNQWRGPRQSPRMVGSGTFLAERGHPHKTGL